MRLSSVRSLKAELLKQRVTSRVITRGSLPRTAMREQSPLPAVSPAPQIALGVAGRGKNFKLAVRLRALTPGIHAVIENITRRARGEVEVKLVGRVVKQIWNRERKRPLCIGGSIGHAEVTAGTLGCFVTADGEEDLILSNNHVLANENDAVKGDPILQPAAFDGGVRSRDTVGELVKFVTLKKRKNEVDAALAAMRNGIEYYFNWLYGMGPIAGVRADPLRIGETVYKLGRTTGKTKGKVSSVEIDGLWVEYDRGLLEFNGQVEITPVGEKPFSLGGDSGSLIVDARHRAVGLLFAGTMSTPPSPIPSGRF